MPLESANAQGQRWHSAASCRKICPITVVLVIIDSCRPSCADPPTTVLPSAEFCTVLSDGGLHPRRLGCIEHDLQSCLYRPWGVKTEPLPQAASQGLRFANVHLWCGTNSDSQMDVVLTATRQTSLVAIAYTLHRGCISLNFQLVTFFCMLIFSHANGWPPPSLCREL